MRYVAFFRGLNVGGNNGVKMAELRAMLSGRGLANVSTYIQSGNALFDSPQEEALLRNEIQEGFCRAFGFGSSVTLRTLAEMEAIVAGVPFSLLQQQEAKAAAAGAQTLYCYLLDETVAECEIQALQRAYAGQGNDLLVAKGREIYLLCYQSVRDSKLATSLATLKRPMTSRNLNTMEKLLALCKTNA